MDVPEPSDRSGPLLVREASSIVIGTVVCGSVIAAAAGHQPSIVELCAGIVVTIVIYWLAGVYAATLATAMRGEERVPVIAARVMARTWHVAATSLVPVAILLTAWILGATIATAATIALGVTVGILALYGYLAGAAAGFRTAARFGSAAAGAVLGLALLLLKGLLGH